MKNVAIIIDLYDGELIDTNYYYNVIGLINATTEIDTVWISTYNICPEELDTDNLFYNSSRDIISEDNFRLKYNQVKDQTTNKKTSPVILNPENYRNDLQLTSHLYPYEIVPYLNDIKKVFFFGKAWDICIQTRPLGINFWKHTDVTIQTLIGSCMYANDTLVDFSRLVMDSDGAGRYTLRKNT